MKRKSMKVDEDKREEMRFRCFDRKNSKDTAWNETDELSDIDTDDLESLVT